MIHLGSASYGELAEAIDAELHTAI
jgi:hypothetical protein